MMTRALAKALVGSILLVVGVASASGEEGLGDSTGTVADVRGRIEAGDYVSAESMARELLAATEKGDGGESGEVVEVLNVLVEALRKGGKAGEPETRELAERGVAIAEASAGPQSPELSASLNELGNVLQALGENETAVSSYERALAIDEANLGPEHPDVAIRLNNLGSVQRSMGNHEEARALLQRAIAIQEKANGPDHLSVTGPLLGLANTLADMRKPAEAQPLYERVIAIREKSLGPGHPQVGRAMNALGLLFYEMGQFKQAESHLERALRIQEGALGPDHPDLAGTLLNLAIVSGITGSRSREIVCYERSLKILEQSLGPDHWRVALTLGNYGLVLKNTGDLLAARATFERALEIFEKSEGDPANVGWILLLLGAVQTNLGDYAEARRYFQRTYEIYEGRFGPDNIRMAGVVGSLGWTYENAGDLQSALDTYLKALAISEAARGPEARSSILHLRRIGQIKQKMGDFEEALTFLERAAAIDAKAEHGRYGRIGNDAALARLHLEAGRPEQAARLYEQIFETWKKISAPDDPSVGGALSDLAEAQLAVGDLDAAFASALRADEIARRHFRNNADGLSAREALRFVSHRSTGLDVILSVAAEDPSPQRARAAFDAVIRSRAMVLDELAERRRIVAATPDLEVAELLESYRRISERVANLAVRGPGRHPDQHRALVAAAEREREQAERSLGKRSATFRARIERAAVTLSDIQASLPLNSALVGYVRYKRGSVLTAGESDRKRWKPVPSYAVFVLRDGVLEMIALGNAAEIDTLVTRWGREVAQGWGAPGWTAEAAEQASRTAGSRLRERVWDPVASRLKDMALVLLVPDASLHQVNFSALPVGDHEYLLESGPLTHYLSAERDLVGFSAPTGEGLLALGAPNFNEESIFAAFAVDEKPPGRLPAKETSLGSFRGERSACGDFSDLHFDPLPASRREVGEIAALWSSGEGSVKAIEVLTGAEATETAFKQRAPGKRIVHLATHGYFMDGICPSAASVADRSHDDADGPLPGDNPLLLSGLALAGANHRGKAGQHEDDGILTAEEVAALDLTTVEWAVLSACETGLGRSQAGEGVFGLRRAFQIAGVSTMIVSLWRVGDEAVRQWMKGLYRARFVDGRSTAESMREASLAILQERRKAGLSTHPFHWAAFVASGNWR